MSKLMEIYRTLYEHFGPQDWWPGESPFEVVVGAILTQQASWKNVEVAIENLKMADMLDVRKIAGAKINEIEELIRPSGFYRQKSKYLKSFCQYIEDEHDASLDKLFSNELGELRGAMLALRGIGPETCDSILLYAGNKMTFVVDAYTVRVCRRMGIIESSKYDEVKLFFEENTEPDVRVFNEFHALFVVLGKRYCKSREQDCVGCPVKKYCRTGLDK